MPLLMTRVLFFNAENRVHDSSDILRLCSEIQRIAWKHAHCKKKVLCSYRFGSLFSFVKNK